MGLLVLWCTRKELILYKKQSDALGKNCSQPIMCHFTVLLHTGSNVPLVSIKHGSNQFNNHILINTREQTSTKMEAQHLDIHLPNRKYMFNKRTLQTPTSSSVHPSSVNCRQCPFQRRDHLWHRHTHRYNNLCIWQEREKNKNQEYETP